MKHACFILDSNKIEFFNNPITGVETVALNGREVSSKFSFFGGLPVSYTHLTLPTIYSV